MDFGLSEEQEMLQQTARDFFAAECPSSLVRALIKDPDGCPRELYRKMAELGLCGLTIPRAYGGTGLGMLDLALVAEEAGRVALPGPFLSGHLAAIAIAAGGSAEQKRKWLPALASGKAVAALGLLEESQRLDAGGVCARARRRGRNFRISGAKTFVEWAGIADFFLVSARTSGRGEEGVTLLIVPRDTPGLTIEPLELVDLTRRAAHVRLDDVEVPPDCVLGKVDAGWKIAARMMDAAAVLLAADSLGGAERALEMAVAYARTREQFGRPIGSFQAIKHMAAEMLSEIEPARSLVWYAAYAFDSVRKDAPRAAAMAKARLSDVYSRVTNRAVQIHGGIGFTWEHDMHFWFKRAKANEFAFGDATYHRERVAALAFGGD